MDVTETVKDEFDLFAAECTGATTNGTFNDSTNSVDGIEISELDIVSVTFYNQPLCDDANAGEDQAKCEDADGITTFDLAGLPDGMQSYEWSNPAGYSEVTINNPNWQTTTVDISAPGVYTIRLTTTKSNGCVKTDDVVLTVNEKPTCSIECTPGDCEGCGEVTLEETGGDAQSWLWSTGETTQSITVDTSGTYSVTITDSNGCTSECEKAVTVNSEPDCEITAPDAVCAELTGNITSVANAGDGATYEWTITNGTITDGDGTNQITWSAGTAGTVTIGVTVTNADGCSCTADAVSVTVNPLPEVEAGPDDTFCDDDDSITLVGTPEGGTWSGPGVTGDTFDPEDAGIGTHVITYSYTDNDGCPNSDTRVFTVEDCGGPPTVITGGIPCEDCTMEIDMLGEIAEIEIGCCSNQTLRSYSPSDPDDVHFLLIDSATGILCGTTSNCGCYPRIIVMRVAEDPADEPENGVFVGPVYDFTGYEDRDWEDPDAQACETVTFGKAVSALIGYDPDDLPDNTVNVGIYVYDPEVGEWVLTQPVPGMVAGVGQAKGLVNHFSQLAVIAEVAEEPSPTESEGAVSELPNEPEELAPAHFVLDTLSIEPSQKIIGLGDIALIIRQGEKVTISANLANDGGQSGDYTAIVKLNGETIYTNKISLSPGQGQEVTIFVTDSEPGQYTVQIGNLVGEFTVVSWTNWWLIGGIIGALVLLGILLWYFGYYRKRRQA